MEPGAMQGLNIIYCLSSSIELTIIGSTNI